MLLDFKIVTWWDFSLRSLRKEKHVCWMCKFKQGKSNSQTRWWCFSSRLCFCSPSKLYNPIVSQPKRSWFVWVTCSFSKHMRHSSQPSQSARARVRSYLRSAEHQITLDLTGGSEQVINLPLSVSRGSACQILTLTQRHGWDKNKYEPCELPLPFAES